MDYLAGGTRSNMVRLVIPVEKFEKENSIIFPHFGRAPLYVVVELLDDGSVKSITPIRNDGEHFGGQGAPETLVTNLGPDAVVVKGMGYRGLQAFQSKGVSVYTGDSTNVRDAIDAYLSGRLVALTEPCRDARHHSGCN
jgi:predicted Fe-Mo cluster-binding NifX family protein